jgi:hypothetical protein
MSKFETEMRLPDGPGEALAACRAAVAELKWKVESQTDRRLVCKELQPAMLASSTWSAKIEIDLREAGDGTLVAVKASNFGMGPIQSSHVKGQAGAFCNQLQVILERRASATAPTQAAVSLSSELQNLASLRDSGVLSQAEFEAAKAKLLAS